MIKSKKFSLQKINRGKKALLLTLLFGCFTPFIVLLVVSFRGEQQKIRDLEKKEFCSHEKSDFLSFGKWECHYCGEVIKINMEGKITFEDYFNKKEPELINLAEKHLQTCEEVKNFTNFLERRKEKGQAYDNEETLKQKQYSKPTIEKIREWGLINRVNLPDLKEERRMGVVKVLGVFTKGKEQRIKSGIVSEELTFLTPFPKLSAIQDFPSLLTEKPKEVKFFYTDWSSKNSYEKIVASFFIWKLLSKRENWNFIIYKLETDDNFRRELVSVSRESGTVSFYLSLLSAYHQKPISRSVAATAFLEFGDYSRSNNCPYCLQEQIIKNPSQQFSKVKISPVGGLEYKIPAAVKAGVKKLILSSEQQANYEQVIPFEIREKLKVYYVKNIEELEELFWKGEFS